MCPVPPEQGLPTRGMMGTSQARPLKHILQLMYAERGLRRSGHHHPSVPASLLNALGAHLMHSLDGEGGPPLRVPGVGYVDRIPWELWLDTRLTR